MPSASSGQEIKNIVVSWNRERAVKKWSRLISDSSEVQSGAIAWFHLVKASSFEKIDENGIYVSLGPSDMRDVVIPVLF